MAQSPFPNKGIVPTPAPRRNSKDKSEDVEIIRALTPIFIATIGAVISIVVIVVKPAEQQGFITLASSAIAGAAGLAQPEKSRKDRED
jgi:hypothetical protein